MESFWYLLLKAGDPFSVSKMKYLLDHDNHAMRESFRTFLKHPMFQPRFDLTLDEERELGKPPFKEHDGSFEHSY